MLQTQQEGQQDGDIVIDAEEGGGLAGALGEWDAWGEEEGIVIVADQAVSALPSVGICLPVHVDLLGGEPLPHAPGPISRGAVRVEMGSDLVVHDTHTFMEYTSHRMTGSQPAYIKAEHDHDNLNNYYPTQHALPR